LLNAAFVLFLIAAVRAIKRVRIRSEPRLVQRQGKTAWFWPTIAAALTSKHHWLVIACDSCGNSD
jgi:hypothetical protein